MSGTDQPRDSRSMTSPRRGTRAAGGQRAPAARDPEAPPPLSAMRRAGVLVVVGALVVSVLLAMGGPSRPGAGPDVTDPPASDPPVTTATPGGEQTPGPTGSVPLVAPQIAPPASTLITTRKVTLGVTIPDPGVPPRSLQLRVYRNDTEVMDPVKVRGLTMNVKDIPLKRGQNRIAVALASAAGVGPPSDEVVIVVDDRPPRLEVEEPGDGSVVNSTLATVRGITEAGLHVTVRNPGYGATEEAIADDSGVFITEIRLARGINRLELTTSDGAGNQARKTLSVERGETAPEARLSLSKPRLKVSELPLSITIRFEVEGPDGQPADGAPVSFTLAVPGLGAETYSAITVDGVARWEGVLIQGARKGNGWVTASADLGPGIAPAVATKPLVVE